MLPAELTSAQVQVWARASVASMNAGFKYRPLKPSSRLYLLTATSAGRSDPSLGWAGFAGAHLVIREIGGTHDSILQVPHVQRLADTLHTELENRDQSGSTAGGRMPSVVKTERDLGPITQS